MGCYICTYFSDPAYEKSIRNRCVFNFWQLHLFPRLLPSYFFIIVLTDPYRGVFHCVLIQFLPLFALALPSLPLDPSLHLLPASGNFFPLSFSLCNSERPKEPTFGARAIRLVEMVVFPSLSKDTDCQLRWKESREYEQFFQHNIFETRMHIGIIQRI